MKLLLDPTDRVSILVNLSDMNAMLSSLDLGQFDFTNFMEQIQEDTVFINRPQMFTGTLANDEAAAGQQKFFSFLMANGWNIDQQPGNDYGLVNVALTAKAMQMAEHTSVYIFILTHSHFSPLFQALTEMGKRVILITNMERGSISAGLRLRQYTSQSLQIDPFTRDSNTAGYEAGA